MSAKIIDLESYKQRLRIEALKRRMNLREISLPTTRDLLKMLYEFEAS